MELDIVLKCIGHSKYVMERLEQVNDCLVLVGPRNGFERKFTSN